MIGMERFTMFMSAWRASLRTRPAQPGPTIWGELGSFERLRGPLFSPFGHDQAAPSGGNPVGSTFTGESPAPGIDPSVPLLKKAI